MDREPTRARTPVILVASDVALPAAHRVWGTGGWLPPEEREALDWLTLSRLLGWRVTVARPSGAGLQEAFAAGGRCVVLACDPDSLEADLVAFLGSRLAVEPLLVVGRAASRDSALAGLAGAAREPDELVGRSLSWTGPGPARTWHCREALTASALTLSRAASSWAALEGAPIVVARPVGRGMVATLAFHPSVARDVDGAVTALLKHLLIWAAQTPVAWIDLEGSLVLRMDDPGGSQNVHLRSWSYPKLREADWMAIAADLKRRQARMAIGYVGGWVDDGDPARGVLRVGGQVPRRIPGRVYSSPRVKYSPRIESPSRAGYGAAGAVQDYEGEFRGIQAVRRAGLGDVELHGHTHMHPDTASWATAADRFEVESWYRELGSPAEAALAARRSNHHPLVLGLGVLRKYFGVRPTTLICPGDQWTNRVLEVALDLALRLVSSYYLALRDGDRFCWTQHVCAPYLDEPNAAWFDAGLPVVGYFHDRDVALGGIDWLGRCLDRWQSAGARRLIDLRELSTAVGHCFDLDLHDGALRLTVTGDGAPPLVRPLTVGVRTPSGEIPSAISVWMQGSRSSIGVDRLSHGVGHVTLAPPESKPGRKEPMGRRRRAPARLTR